jgi:ATP-binding cassette subfamily A (ABC1) protein 3
MSSPRRPPQWRRIYRQTITLIYKNLLIAFKAPIATICRALLFPIAVTLIFCFLKHVRVISSSSIDPSIFGIANSSTPIGTLGAAINASPNRKLVFVRNGISNATLGPIIGGILNDPGMKGVEGFSVDDPNDLFELCRQSLAGSSDCYAAVLFSSFNDTTVEYSIAMDESTLSLSKSNGGYGDHTPNSKLNRLIFPLQWALDSHIGNFSTITPPSTVPWSGFFGPNSITYANSFVSLYAASEATTASYWLYLVNQFVAPVFFLVLIGVVYHLNTFVATERQTTISELMAAQNVTATPRILSTLITFYSIYFPGFLICSILFTQILFTRTSDILFLFVTLLAGAAVITSSHFVASFFGKAQLAGLYSSTLAISLAFVALSASLRYTPPQAEMFALSLIFPPYCFANFISDVARREFLLHAFSLENIPPLFSDYDEIIFQNLDGYFYIVFFVIQIAAYTAGTYAIERTLWGVPRTYEHIPAESEIALRCTALSKTYKGKRRWYWPFMRKGATVLAVDNLNLEVKKGSVTFLLGPNGGGKTTTLKCVAGMISMDSGSALALNEAGVVFGICPQTNVSWVDLLKIFLANASRSFGITLQFKSISRSGGSSKLLRSKMWRSMMMIFWRNAILWRRHKPARKL